MKKRKQKDFRSYVNIWYVLIPFLYLVFVYIAPLVKMLYMSFFEFQGVGKPLGAFTLENYSKFITNAFYWKVLGMTVLLSFISTLLCVAVGYPVAYCIARAEAKKKSILTTLVVLPLWVSITIRMYGWMSIFSGGSLMGTYAGVLIGLVHCGLPYIIMILIGPIENIESSLEEASYVFGAGFLKTFFTITIPLTFKGILSGVLLVFALNTAAFMVPVMLGSGKITLMTNLVYQQSMFVYDWGFAAAISVIFLITALVITNLGHLIERMPEKKDRRKGELDETVEISR